MTKRFFRELPWLAAVLTLSACGTSDNFKPKPAASPDSPLEVRTDPNDPIPRPTLPKWKEVEGAKYLCLKEGEEKTQWLVTENNDALGAFEAKGDDSPLVQVRFDQIEAVKNWVATVQPKLAPLSSIPLAKEQWWGLKADIRPESLKDKVLSNSRFHLAKRNHMDGRRMKTNYWDIVFRVFEDNSATINLQKYSTDNVMGYQGDLGWTSVVKLSYCIRK